MAEEVPKRISLKILTDKENNRVIFAEAKSDFVDILLSFLTLPVGTVIRLLSKQSQQLELGCMHNLYSSVENLEGTHFWNSMCKTMLLHTRNSSADFCRKLKVNIDDTEPLKYYVCPKLSNDHAHAPKGLLSTFCHGRCGCGEKLTKEMILRQPSSTIDEENGVFLNARGTFMITDDLQIMPLSAETTLGLLNNLGARTEALEVKAIDYSQEEATLLLKHMLFSKASLTDTFLPKQREVSSKPKLEEPVEFYLAKREEIGEVQKISLNVLVQKSSNKIVCAEVGDDFVSFLMSILTFPLGAVVKLLDGIPSLRSISTLYKSVEALNVDKYMKSKHHKELLLSPKIAFQYGCKYQLLEIVESTSPSYFYNLYTKYSSTYRSMEDPVTTTEESLTTTKWYPLSSVLNYYSTELDLFRIEGFVRGPATFMVTDALEVTPFSSMSTVTMLTQLKIPIDDVKMQVLSIGYTEALEIFGAALTTVFGSITRRGTIACSEKDPGGSY